MYRGFFTTVAIILVALLDQSMIGALPFGLWRIHLLPLVLIFTYLLFNIRVAAWWALIGGLVLEIYSFHNFGFYLVMLWLCLGLIYFLFSKVMTNRSLYSVMTAGAAVTIVCDVYIVIADYLAGIPHLSFATLTEKIFLSLIINLLCTIVVFYIIHFASRRLRPVFLNFSR